MLLEFIEQSEDVMVGLRCSLRVAVVSLVIITVILAIIIFFLFVVGSRRRRRSAANDRSGRSESKHSGCVLLMPNMYASNPLANAGRARW